MRIVVIDRIQPEPELIAAAAAELRAGRLVAFPTETVYGLGANALDASAVARIFEAKGRPSYNPLIVHVADEASARDLVREWPERASKLAHAFWPGPLTLVLRKRDVVPDVVTAGSGSVAIRVPAHPVALALLGAARIPLAAPSANRSTELSPTTAQHVARSLGDRVDLIVDGGPTDVGIESTVLDLRGAAASILRPGIIGPRELEPIVGPLAAPHATKADEPRPAPGMLDRHYAPRARLLLFDSAGAKDALAEQARLIGRGLRVGMIVIRARVEGTYVARLPNDATRYAQRLYATLHELDEAGVGVIFVERVPNGTEWDGVRDRLERAARPAE